MIENRSIKHIAYFEGDHVSFDKCSIFCEATGELALTQQNKTGLKVYKQCKYFSKISQKLSI